MPIDDILPKSEFSHQFVEYMKNRMFISFNKYGPVADGFPHKVNAIESLHLRLKKYEETGNTEYLVDAANFAMIEFMHPKHKNAHFEGTDNAGSPGRVTTEGRITKRPNDEIGEPGT